MAIYKKIVNGLERPIKRIEIKSSNKFLPSLLCFFNCFTGLAINILKPINAIINPPIILMISCCSLRKLIMKDIPSPAIKAKIASAVAIPIPEEKPEDFPLLRVRCIHKTPIGPNGIDTTKPTINPLIKNCNSIILL